MPTRYQGSPDEILALDTFIKLTRATESVVAKLPMQLAAHDLTLGQLAVLEALLHLGSMCQRDLGKKLLRSNPNVTLVLDNLAKRGLVVRERSEADRRMINVSLTKRGRELIERVLPDHVACITALMSHLTPDEQRALAGLCKKLGLGVAGATVPSSP